MFGLFKKREKNTEFFDTESVIVTYTGEVLSADFTAESLNRTDVHNYGYPFHNLYPHGHGHIVYTLHGEIIEEYEGEFDVGQYHGRGKLYFKGATYEGNFDEGICLDGPRNK
jgi:hypothetical protein